MSDDAPIPMRIICPGVVDGRICGELHIDDGEFATKPHHTHSPWSGLDAPLQKEPR